MKRPPQSRMAVILNLMREELVDLCAKRGAVQEQLRQLEQAIETVQREQKRIEESSSPDERSSGQPRATPADALKSSTAHRKTEPNQQGAGVGASRVS